ncbi:GMC family oxidoreductase N-terminal domain-containing protein [Mycolicibacterium sp. 624]|uniref:GMC family oxidoreductase n=1 Tax=Mycolicibacterium sp. 624 TaxID=3156314 RepID=UPI003398273F
MTFDYIIVGAGSAGSVLAARLSEDPAIRVLLLEAGGKDKSPLIRVPKGFGKLLGDSNYTWSFPTRAFGPTNRVEAWARGKTLGGSSAINGLVYNRGQRGDWDDLARVGGSNWGWDEIVPAYKAIENNILGASTTRGVNGPLTISRVEDADPLCEVMIDSGKTVGMQRAEDVNETDDERIGYTMANIANGRRVSAAHAFLNPARRRPNLTIMTKSHAVKLLFDGDRAVGVRSRQGGQLVDFRATKDVVLCLGSMQTPRLLQLSGIGPAEVLRAAGVDVLVDQASVGGRMREHRCFVLNYRLKQDLGLNKTLSSSLGQGVAAVKYLATHRGPLASPSYDVIGFLKSGEATDRVDGQVLLAPFSVASMRPGQNPELEREPGLQAIGFVSRPTSEGHCHITSANPDAPLDIETNYYGSAEDRSTGLAVFAKMRHMFENGPISEYIAHETVPGSDVTDDQDIIDNALAHGYCGYHAIGTSGMGLEDTAVVDSSLRVRGVSGLRVMDCSVLPVMVAGNLNAPMMAMAWHAADVIRDGV